MKPQTVFYAVCLEIEWHRQTNRSERGAVQDYNMMIVFPRCPILDHMGEAPELVLVFDSIGGAPHLHEIGAR